MTTTYKEVFQLAEHKGYKLFFDWTNPFEGEEGIHQSIIDTNHERALSELALIQTWLRDTFKVRVEVIGNAHNELCAFNVYFVDGYYTKPSIGCSPAFDDEQARLEGVNAALEKLI
jgi:hypothetical protein